MAPTPGERLERYSFPALGWRYEITCDPQGVYRVDQAGLTLAVRNSLQEARRALRSRALGATAILLKSAEGPDRRALAALRQTLQTAGIGGYREREERVDVGE